MVSYSVLRNQVEKIKYYVSAFLKNLRHSNFKLYFIEMSYANDLKVEI